MPAALPDHLCYLNGSYLPVSEAKVSVLDRGFIFGDGIYEVVPVYGQRLFRFDEHMGRLGRSLRPSSKRCQWGKRACRPRRQAWMRRARWAPGLPTLPRLQGTAGRRRRRPRRRRPSLSAVPSAGLGW